jgi:hypothetical protein
MGRPVSSFDIGGLVADVREEQRRQKGNRPKQQTLIGSLIQDAIMSFRSLTEEEVNTTQPSPDEQSGVGAIPLSFGTFDGSGPNSRPPSSEPSQLSFPRREPSYSDNYQAGNLAALEDHSAEAPLAGGQDPRNAGGGRTPYAYDPAVLAPGRSHSHPAPPMTYPGAGPHPAFAQPPTRLPLTYWVVTATLVAVGAAVGAYLAGVFS